MNQKRIMFSPMAIIGAIFLIFTSCGVSREDQEWVKSNLNETINNLYVDNGYDVIVRDLETDNFEKNDSGFSCVFKCVLEPINGDPDLYFSGWSGFDEDGYVRKFSDGKFNILIFDLSIHTDEYPYVENVLLDDRCKYNLPLRTYCY